MFYVSSFVGASVAQLSEPVLQLSQAADTELVSSFVIQGLSHGLCFRFCVSGFVLG